MSSSEWGSLRLFVALLLLLQLVSVLLAWSLNPIGRQSETSFALLLAADLIAFSIVSYLARTHNQEGGTRGPVVLAGSTAVLFFMLLALFSQGSI